MSFRCKNWLLSLNWFFSMTFFIPLLPDGLIIVITIVGGGGGGGGVLFSVGMPGSGWGYRDFAVLANH